MINLQQLEEITDLRSIWKNEATDFTPWLAEDENISILGDAVGLDITVDEQESAVGDFSVDIFAKETGTDRKIIIENQLEDTNHDHLGKLITYASGKAADIIIWVVKHAREEHRSAIEWLNNHTDEKIGFFLCEIKLYKIGNSEPAVKFEVIEKPNDWAKEIKKKDAQSPTEQARQEYWNSFNEYAFQNSEYAKTFSRRKPSTDHWMDLSIGSSACHLSLLQVRKYELIAVELNIPDDKEFFRNLYSKKDQIEKDSGLSFDWRELPDKKASRILVREQVDFDDKSKWNDQFDWLITTALKVRKTFKKYI